MRYVVFLVDLGTRAIKGKVEFAPDDRQSDNAFVWCVACDWSGNVCVRAAKRQLIATAIYNDTLAKLRQHQVNEPTDYQWAVIEDALKKAQAEAERAQPEACFYAETETLVDNAFVGNAHFRRDLDSYGPPAADEPPPRPTDDRPRPTPQRQRSGNDRERQRRGNIARVVAVVGALVIVGALVTVVAMLVTMKPPKPTIIPAPTTKRTVTPPPPAPVPLPPEPMPPPPPEVATIADALAIARRAGRDGEPITNRKLAAYAAANLKWADVHVPPETTLPKIEKDPAEERGKRLCVAGTIDRIERTDLEGRKLYTGALTTADGDHVSFVAVGTTGDLVKRSAATLCGIVTGKAKSAAAVIGMFDLPENAKPTVEQ